MATYTTTKDCFIGNALRKAGETFTIDKKIDKLPEWLTSSELTPQQKANETKARNEAIKKAEDDARDIAMESNRAANSKVEKL